MAGAVGCQATCILNSQRISRFNRWQAAIPLILLLGGGWLWISRPSLDASTFGTPRPAILHPAPDFTLHRYGSNPAVDELFTLSAAQGRPVVLNFWATWCGPCRREFPALQAASMRQGACGTEMQGGANPDCVLILGINQGESAAAVEQFLAALGEDGSSSEPGARAGPSQFPILLDNDLEVGRRYNVQGLPLTYFIDGESIIRSVWAGEMNSVILAENIAKIAP